MIDDFHTPDKRSRLGTRWRLGTPTVIGGISTAPMGLSGLGWRPALCVEASQVLTGHHTGPDDEDESAHERTADH